MNAQLMVSMSLMNFEIFSLEQGPLLNINNILFEATMGKNNNDGSATSSHGNMATNSTMNLNFYSTRSYLSGPPSVQSYSSRGTSQGREQPNIQYFRHY